MRTGYFGNPIRTTKIHVVDMYDKPICGCKIGPDMDFQWCAAAMRLDYIECKKCENKVIKFLINENFNMFRKNPYAKIP